MVYHASWGLDSSSKGMIDRYVVGEKERGRVTLRPLEAVIMDCGPKGDGAVK